MYIKLSLLPNGPITLLLIPLSLVGILAPAPARGPGPLSVIIHLPPGPVLIYLSLGPPVGQVKSSVQEPNGPGLLHLYLHLLGIIPPLG